MFAATLGGDYFPPQLIYKGKTCRRHPQLPFPQGWDICHTENRWSNEETMRRYIERIFVPFIAKKREVLKLPSDYPALALFDGFKGQTTDGIRMSDS